MTHAHAITDGDIVLAAIDVVVLPQRVRCPQQRRGGALVG